MEKATIRFSDKSSLQLELTKTKAAQEFVFDNKQIEWLELEQLINAEGDSPFPVLVQIEVYGRG